MLSKYSFLMSVYDKDKPEFLIQSIHSMLNQTLPPDQIVIVKDGFLSIDLEKIINNFHVEYSEIFTVIQLKENIGLGLALNEGLKLCRNDLVARMDSDDISIKERCELQVREFSFNENLVILGSNIDEFINSPNKVKSTRTVPETYNEILKFSRRRNPFNHPTVMFKKSIVQNFGAYKNFRRNQDFELFVTMINNGCLAKNINKSLVLFRISFDNHLRRKSWTKCSSDIKIVYNFWQNGYSDFIDFLVILLAQIVVFVIPLKVFKWLSDNYLRNKVNLNS